MPKIIENLYDEIVSAAVDLILTQGTESCSIRAVAKQCHIAVGTVYNYFDSKEALFDAVVEQRWQHCQQQLDEIMAGDWALLDALDAFGTIIRNFLDPVRSIWISAHPSMQNERKATTDSSKLNDKSKRSEIPVMARTEHPVEKRSQIIKTLMEHISQLLERAGANPSQIDALTFTIAQLIIICGHDATLDFRGIVTTCTSIEKIAALKAL